MDKLRIIHTYIYIYMLLSHITSWHSSADLENIKNVNISIILPYNEKLVVLGM